MRVSHHGGRQKGTEATGARRAAAGRTKALRAVRGEVSLGSAKRSASHGPDFLICQMG